MVSEENSMFPPEHPVVVSWKRFCETDEFKNALHWAVETRYGDGRFIGSEQREKHAKGSMWFAFLKGMEAAGSRDPW